MHPCPVLSPAHTLAWSAATGSLGNAAPTRAWRAQDARVGELNTRLLALQVQQADAPQEKDFVLSMGDKGLKHLKPVEGKKLKVTAPV